jgi:hypothetical protein
VKLHSYALSEALAALEQHFRSRRNPFTNTLLTMSNIINMRAFGSKMIAGVAIAGTMTIAMGTSAQAAGLTGRIDFFGVADATGTSINFTNFTGTPIDGAPGPFNAPIATGSFSIFNVLYPAIIGSIKDVSVPSPVVPDFINFDAGLATIGGFTPAQIADYRFKLTSIVQTSASLYSFKGVFGDNSLGEGQIATPINEMGTRTYAGNLSVVPVPTPALLPGLIGIGMAAMRKRQSKTATA